MNEETRWIPQLRGAIYCSPACGHGCTFEAFDRAYEQATTLATRLGRGWTPRVWENLGWHFCVQGPFKGLSVYVVNGEYYADIDHVIRSAYFQDPRRAVEDIVVILSQHVQEKVAQLTELAQALATS